MFIMKVFRWISCANNPLKFSRNALNVVIGSSASCARLLATSACCGRPWGVVIWLYAKVGIGIELSLGGIVWILFFDNIVIMLAALVVRWVIPATQGTFCWRVPSLIAVFVVWAATFDTRVGFLAVRLCVRTVDIVHIVGCVYCSFEGVLCG